MTTSSRMEQSIRPDYHHHLQHPHHHQPIHSLHEGSLPGSNDEPTHRPLPPLAYLTAAAAASSPLLVSSSPTMGDSQQPQQQPQPLRDREDHPFPRKSVEDHRRHDQGPTSSLGSGQFTHQPVPTPRFQVQSQLSRDERENNSQHNKEVETSREYLSDKDRRSSEDRGLYAQQHQQQQRHQDQEAVHPFASSAEDSRRLTILSKTTSSAYDSSSTVSEFAPDVEMKTTAVPSRRGSMAMILDQRSPTPSPKDTHDQHDHPRQGSHYHYSQEQPHSQQRRSSHAFISSEYASSYSGPRHPHESQYSSGSGLHPGQSQISPTTPSPPLPSTLSVDFHQRRPLPPIEPSHPLHSFMSNSRRDSVTDPELHAVVAGELRRRPSMATLDTSTSGGHYNTNHGVSPTSTTASSPSDSNYPPHGSHSPRHHPPHHQQYTSGPLPPTPVGPPSESALAAYLANRRESLPSIHSRAGPLGQLLAQEPQRRHSIANGSLDPNSSSSSAMNNNGSSALKRKTSGILLTQVHTTSTLDYPAKRRDSIPDLHLTHSGGPGGMGGGHLHPSPPRRGSIASLSSTTNGSSGSTSGPNVPALNLQPAAEIKSSSSSSSSSSSGQGPLDYARQFPIHPMRRPSLFSESGLPTPPSQLPSRRASLADLHLNQQQPSPQQPFQRHPPGPSSSSTSSSQHDYDYHMGMDLEKMHLSSQGPEPMPHSSKQQGPPSSGSHYPASHLYPGYGYGVDNGSTGFGGPGGFNNKGDTPYSRSPELRVSHKLAERKRRKEMKELFDELRDALPVDRSLKTSKWEILSKAVDYIANMKVNQDGMAREIEMLRQELSRLKR